MKRNAAISAMGVGIIFVIVLGIVMIVSAPMIAKKNVKNENFEQKSYNNEDFHKTSFNTDEHLDYRQNEDKREESDISKNYPQDGLSALRAEMNNNIQNTESRIYDRIDARLREISMQTSNQGVKDKYVCSIVSYVDSQGQPISPNASDKSKAVKFVFECEYVR